MNQDYIKYPRKAIQQGLAGYSLSITIPKDICQQLNIEAGTPLTIYKQGNKIIIEKERKNESYNSYK